MLLAIVESSGSRPAPDEAAAALLDAGSARDQLAHRLTLPSWFCTSICLVVVVQIATLAVGVAGQTPAGIGLAVAGLVPFVLVAVVQLVRFRRLNGVWAGGLASRVVLGGDAAATTVHFLAMGAAIWAAARHLRHEGGVGKFVADDPAVAAARDRPRAAQVAQA
jgi:hypothetical protein